MNSERDFYLTDGITLAEKLLGKTLVHKIGERELCGVVTETEAYMGVLDKASHAYGGKRTKRTETMYFQGGYSYVYLIYGMYSCMNITANKEGIPEAVLIRAIKPVGDISFMYEKIKEKSRRSRLPDSVCELKEKELCALTNGPGKLCIAMDIDTRIHNAIDMTGNELFVRDDGYTPKSVAASSRIGIDYAEEAAFYPWRFTAYGI